MVTLLKKMFCHTKNTSQMPPKSVHNSLSYVCKTFNNVQTFWLKIQILFYYSQWPPVAPSGHLWHCSYDSMKVFKTVDRHLNNW